MPDIFLTLTTVCAPQELTFQGAMSLQGGTVSAAERDPGVTEPWGKSEAFLVW